MKQFSKFSIIMVVMILAFSVYVQALTPLVSFKSQSDSIDSSDRFIPAIYKITIKNNDVDQDRFQLYTISAFWDINPTIVTVEGNGVYTFDLEILLTDKDVVGPQLVPVTVKSLNSGDFVAENLYVYVKPSDYVPQSYVPNVAVDVKTKDKIDPRDPISIEIYMRNRNPLDIKDLRIVVESELFSKEYLTTLGPLEEKTNQILFADLNKLQKPGTYPINIKIVVDNKTVSQIEKEVQVVSYSEVSVEQTTIKGMFSYTQKIKLHNNGNNDATKLVKIEKTWIEKIFTKTSARYNSLNEDGVSYISWSVPLGPQESIEITSTTNYNILVIIALIIVGLVIVYYILRSPVLLFKRAKIVSSNDEGISEIKVKLHLKNRSGQLVRNIKVVDKYPKIVTLVEDTSIGSLKPTKMLSADKSHSLLMWNLEQLEPYEERLLTYSVRSRLNIIGNMSLHPAKVKFVSKSGERTYKSNDVQLFHKSEDVVEYK